MAAFESGRRLYAKYDALEVFEVMLCDVVGVMCVLFVSVSGVLSEVCCMFVEELLSGGGDVVAAACAFRDGVAARSVRVGVLMCLDCVVVGMYVDESGLLVECVVCEYVVVFGVLVIVEILRVVVVDDVDDIEVAFRDLMF